jgi:hypothetical protein
MPALAGYARELAMLNLLTFTIVAVALGMPLVLPLMWGPIENAWGEVSFMTAAERYQPGAASRFRSTVSVLVRTWMTQTDIPVVVLIQEPFGHSFDGGGTMPTCEDYKQMARRVAQLAIATSAPTLSQALMALAVDHMTRAARLSELQDSQQQQRSMQQEQSAGYGD